MFASVSPDDEVAVAAKVVEGEMLLLLTEAAADALTAGGDLLPVHAVAATTPRWDLVVE